MNREDAKNAKKTHERDIEEVTSLIVDCAIKVHRTLGPGLLESVYQACLRYELESADLEVRCEVPQPIRYGGIAIDAGYRIDMVVHELVVVENKTVDRLLPIHAAQLLTYLKLSDRRLGFLLNWNVKLMKDGIKRFINNL